MTDEKYNPLTVSELILRLAEFPPDTPVYTEGCDCIGKAFALETYEQNGQAQVLIVRPPDKS